VPRETRHRWSSGKPRAREMLARVERVRRCSPPPWIRGHLLSPSGQRNYGAPDRQRFSVTLHNTYRGLNWFRNGDADAIQPSQRNPRRRCPERNRAALGPRRRPGASRQWGRSRGPGTRHSGVTSSCDLAPARCGASWSNTGTAPKTMWLSATHDPWRRGCVRAIIIDQACPGATSGPACQRPCAAGQDGRRYSSRGKCPCSAADHAFDKPNPPGRGTFPMQTIKPRRGQTKGRG
jgi:hypothetical protein